MILCIVIIIAIVLLILAYPSNSNREHFEEPPISIEERELIIDPEEIVTYADVQKQEEPPSIMTNMSTWYPNEWLDHFDENGDPVYLKRESEPIDIHNIITDMPITVEPFENEPISFVYDRFSGL
jgi:hypothetical protein